MSLEQSPLVPFKKLLQRFKHFVTSLKCHQDVSRVYILCQGDAITDWDQGNVSLDDLVKAQKAGLLNEKTNEAILKELARDAFILKEDTSMPPSGDGVSSLGR